MRRCSQGSPVARQSSQPSTASGSCVIAMWSRCVHAAMEPPDLAVVRAWRLGPVAPGPRPRTVVLNCAGGAQIGVEDRLDVERDLDLIADDHSSAGDLVLPGDGEVVSVDARLGFEADAGQRALVLRADPERRLPPAEVGDIHLHRTGDSADGQIGQRLVVDVAGPLRQAPGERDLWVVLDVEEGRAAQMGIAVGLAGPQPGGVDLTGEGRVEWF